jgi:hypothetical protein
MVLNNVLETVGRGVVLLLYGVPPALLTCGTILGRAWPDECPNRNTSWPLSLDDERTIVTPNNHGIC